MTASSRTRSSELISELLHGMRLKGVLFSRLQIPSSTGIGFTNVAGRGQFHFVGKGPVWLRSPAGAMHKLDTGDAVLIPRGGRHAVLTSSDMAELTLLDVEAAKNAVQNSNEHCVIFSCCMDFDLGGMQPVMAAMPEAMLVSTLVEKSPELQPMLDAMERETMAEEAGYAGILARLAEVVAALIVRGWLTTGCGNATGWIRALHDPRLSRAIFMMHKEPGKSWTTAELAKEAGQSRSGFSQHFLQATGTSPLRYLTELRMRLALIALRNERLPVDVVAARVGYGSLAAFSRAFKRTTGISPGAVRGSGR